MRLLTCILLPVVAVACVADPSGTEPRNAPSPPTASSAAIAPAPPSSAPPAPIAAPCPAPIRQVDHSSVKATATRTTACRRLPTQKPLASAPDFVIETRCPGPDADTTLEVNTEDDRTFFAVARAGTARLPLAPAVASFNTPGGTARWYRIGDAPPEALVVPLRVSTTDDQGKQRVEAFVVAWDLRSGKVCRTVNAGPAESADVEMAIDTFGRMALAGDCDCAGRQSP